jgi:hypothetical protein
MCDPNVNRLIGGHSFILISGIVPAFIAKQKKQSLTSSSIVASSQDRQLALSWHCRLSSRQHKGTAECYTDGVIVGLPSSSNKNIALQNAKTAVYGMQAAKQRGS